MGVLSLDASTPASVWNEADDTTTTASFTPPANALLVAWLRYNTSTGESPADPTIANSGSALTWTLRAHNRTPEIVAGADGCVAAFTAPVAASAAMTVTATDFGTGNTGAALKVQVWVDDSGDTPGVGAVVEGASASAITSVAQGFTATADGSRGIIGFEDWNGVSAPTAGAGCTLTGGDSANQGWMAYAVGLRSANDGVAGATTTLNLSFSSTSETRWIVLEVTPGGPPTLTAPTVAGTGAIAANVAGITPALPAGLAEHDVVVIPIETGNQAVTVPVPWAHVTGSPVAMATAQATRLTAIWARVPSGGLSAPVIADPGDHIIGRAFAVRGCKTTGDPWNFVNTGTETTSDTSASFPTGTTTVDKCLIVNIIVTGTDVATNSTAHYSAWANASLASIVEVIDNTRNEGNGGTIGVAAGVKTTAGAVSATTATVLTAATKAMMTIAFEPAPLPVTLPSPATVVDDFDDNSISAAWSNWGGAQVTESSGRLNLTTTTAAAYFGIERVSAVDLTGAYVGARVVLAGNQALASFRAYPIDLLFSAGNEAYWVVTGNTAQCWTNVGGTYTQRGASLTYSAATHVWFAIGESGGDLQWLWSTDGTNWTVHASATNPFAGDTVVNPYVMVGTDAAEASTTTLQVDDFTTWGIAAGAEVAGSVSSTLGALTAAAVGARAVSGTVDSALGALTTTGAGQRGVGAAVSTALGALTAAAAGARQVPAVVASALGGIAATSAGQRSTAGTTAASLGGLTATAAAVRTTAGFAAANLGALASAAAGALERAGAIASNLGGLTALGSGQRTIAATISTMLGGLTTTAGGSRSTAGSAAAVLGALAAPAVGVREASGAAAAALLGLTATALGGRTATGVTTSVLGALTAAGAGVRDTFGSAGTGLGPLAATVLGAGAALTTGAASTILGALTAAASGARTATGSSASLLGALTAPVLGARIASGSSAAVFGALTATASAVRTATGASATTLGAAAATAVGIRSATAYAAADLGALAAAAAGTVARHGLVVTELGGLSAVITVGDPGRPIVPRPFIGQVSPYDDGIVPRPFVGVVTRPL